MPDAVPSSRIVERYFQAMRRGAEAEDELVGLFAEDATYLEPFTGRVRTHRGRAAIRSCFRAGWSEPVPDLEVTVHRVEVAGDHATATWTCTSPAFDGPVHGRDEYVIRAGQIERLEVTFEPKDP